MADTPHKVKPQELETKEPFVSLFSHNRVMVDAIATSMRKSGYDSAFPIVCWHGVVIDGHTRKAAAVKAKLLVVPCIYKDFTDESAALEYAIACQRNRRNLTDAEMLRCIGELDKRKAQGERTDLAQGCAKSEDRAPKSSAATATILGISQRKVEQARTVMDRATPEVKAAVEAGGMTINAAYTETVKPKEESTEDKIAKWHTNLMSIATKRNRNEWPLVIQAFRQVADELEGMI